MSHGTTKSNGGGTTSKQQPAPLASSQATSMHHPYYSSNAGTPSYSSSSTSSSTSSAPVASSTNDNEPGGKTRIQTILASSFFSVSSRFSHWLRCILRHLVSWPSRPERMFLSMIFRAVTDPRTSRRVALKKMPNVFQSVVAARRAFREIKMLCTFRHDNVKDRSLLKTRLNGFRRSFLRFFKRWIFFNLLVKSNCSTKCSYSTRYRLHFVDRRRRRHFQIYFDGIDANRSAQNYRLSTSVDHRSLQSVSLSDSSRIEISSFGGCHTSRFEAGQSSCQQRLSSQSKAIEIVRRVTRSFVPSFRFVILV